MDPFSALLGLGLTAVGTFMGMGAASDYNVAQKKDIQLEQQVEGQRKQAAQLKYERDSMEVFRNNQRARAQGLEAATSQGAQFGSGLQGAYGQIRGQTGYNLLGINQNKEIGDNVFGLNAQISNTKIDMANSQKDQQLAQGITSLGSSIFGSSKALGNIFSGYSNSTPTPNYGMGLYKGNQTGMQY